MPDLSTNQRQAVVGAGCGIALVAVIGAGLVGYFARAGIGWLWLIVMTFILLMGIGGLLSVIQKVLDSGESGGGGSKPDPSPGPSSRHRAPSHWPPKSDL